MAGSLQVKNGKYYAVVDFYDEAGKRKQKWIGTGYEVRGNKRKASDFLDKIVAEHAEQEPYLKKGQILFSDFLQQWLDGKKGKIEMSTWESYQVYSEKHIIPYFKRKGLTLTQLLPKHFIDYYNYEFKEGRCNGKGGMSIRSIKSYSLIIKESLNMAVIMEYVGRNPALNIPLPKSEEKKQIGVFLNAAEANEVIKAFRDHHLHELVYVTLYYGLRRSEVLGLKWSAVNFDKNTIQINHTVVKNITIVAKDKTKTISSNRSYVLLPEIKEVLLNLKHKTDTNKKLFGSEYIDTNYIFTWPDGKPFAPDYVTRGFQRVLKNHELPKMRFHDLRHSTASILYDKGWALKDIQDWLGHADIETTANIYTHISKLRKQNMAKDIEHVFSL